MASPSGYVYQSKKGRDFFTAFPVRNKKAAENMKKFRGSRYAPITQSGDGGLLHHGFSPPPAVRGKRCHHHVLPFLFFYMIRVITDLGCFCQ
jgi:hypothetical protein